MLCQGEAQQQAWEILFLSLFSCSARPAACRIGGAPMPGPVTALLSAFFFFFGLPCCVCVNSVNSGPVCLLGLSVQLATRSGENCPSSGVGEDMCFTWEHQRAQRRVCCPVRATDVPLRDMRKCAVPHIQSRLFAPTGCCAACACAAGWSPTGLHVTGHPGPDLT